MNIVGLGGKIEKSEYLSPIIDTESNRELMLLKGIVIDVNHNIDFDQQFLPDEYMGFMGQIR
ncbi:hypothetical protein HK096_002135, partial [Nowakowskiella sp. JEL0078]